MLPEDQFARKFHEICSIRMKRVTLPGQAETMFIGYRQNSFAAEATNKMGFNNVLCTFNVLTRFRIESFGST